eukprot:m.203162 g.203162  ORF g.203162 m.203162 type:complete len:464 (+) comp25997_c1_seq6:102-1493(+)
MEAFLEFQAALRKFKRIFRRATLWDPQFEPALCSLFHEACVRLIVCRKYHTRSFVRRGDNYKDVQTIEKPHELFEEIDPKSLIASEKFMKQTTKTVKRALCRPVSLRSIRYVADKHGGCEYILPDDVTGTLAPNSFGFLIQFHSSWRDSLSVEISEGQTTLECSDCNFLIFPHGSSCYINKFKGRTRFAHVAEIFLEENEHVVDEQDATSVPDRLTPEPNPERRWEQCLGRKGKSVITLSPSADLQFMDLLPLLQTLTAKGPMVLPCVNPTPRTFDVSRKHLMGLDYLLYDFLSEQKSLKFHLTCLAIMYSKHDEYYGEPSMDCLIFPWSPLVIKQAAQPGPFILPSNSSKIWHFAAGRKFLRTCILCIKRVLRTTQQLPTELLLYLCGYFKPHDVLEMPERLFFGNATVPVYFSGFESPVNLEVRHDYNCYRPAIDEFHENTESSNFATDYFWGFVIEEAAS